MFKKAIFSVSIVTLFPCLALAQDVEASKDGYNHLSLSYDATFCSSSLSALDDVEGFPGSFTLNGMSLNYLHGFHIPVTNLPMFIETGASLGFNNGSYVDEGYDLDFNHNRPTVSIDSRNTLSFRNFNLEIPVFYLYRFQTSRRFSIAPYAGFNFKIHLATGIKEKWQTMNGNQYTEDEYEWTNAYDKEVWGKCWNRFQVGAGAGVRITLDNKWTFSAQYLFDLNPVAHLKEDMSDVKAHTATLRIAAGYKF
jgi:hypothetical protein